MATKPSWISVSPAAGSGNGSVENTASEHTGRVARTGIVSVVGVGVTFDESKHTYRVTQTPKAEFVSFDGGTEMAADKEGGNVTITGKSNSTKLTISTTAGDITLPAKYNAAGLSVSNGAAIPDDPGAVSQYDFSVTIPIPANTTTGEVERTIKITANGGQVAQIVIKQTAGDAMLSISPKEITIPQTGGSVSVAVTSNTSWTVQ